MTIEDLQAEGFAERWVDLKNDKTEAVSEHKVARTTPGAVSDVKNRFLRKKQGDEQKQASVIDALKFSGGKYGYGQVLLKFNFDDAELEDKESYKEAIEKLLEEQRKLKDKAKSLRELGTKEERSDDLLSPKRTAKCVMVHVFSAQNLPAADANSSCDPYLKASVMGTESRTSAKSQTQFPFWYETLALKGNFPTSQDYFDSGLVAPLLLQLYDRDTFSFDDFIGCCEISLKGVTAAMPQQPSWYCSMQ